MKVSQLIEMLSKYPADMNVVGINKDHANGDDYEYIGDLELSETLIINNPCTNEIESIRDVYGYCVLPMSEEVWGSGFEQPTPYKVLMVSYTGLGCGSHLDYEKRDELSPDELNKIIDKESE